MSCLLYTSESVRNSDHATEVRKQGTYELYIGYTSPDHVHEGGVIHGHAGRGIADVELIGCLLYTSRCV